MMAVQQVEWAAGMCESSLLFCAFVDQEHKALAPPTPLSDSGQRTQCPSALSSACLQNRGDLSAWPSPPGGLGGEMAHSRCLLYVGRDVTALACSHVWCHLCVALPVMSVHFPCMSFLPVWQASASAFLRTRVSGDCFLSTDHCDTK